MSTSEKEWQLVIKYVDILLHSNLCFHYRMALEDALTLLISAYHTVVNIPELKPQVDGEVSLISCHDYPTIQVCYQASRCLYTIALHKSPDSEMQWNKELMSVIASLLKSDNRDESNLNPLDHYSALSRVMRKDSANKAEVILLAN